MNKDIKLSLVLLLVCLCGCATIYNPATQKNEFYFFSTEDEVSIGKSLSQDVNKKLQILDDWDMNNRLDSIGKRVALASDRNDLEYNFFIVDEDQLNAFALPGGFIYVNKALMETATDDELACVLGHEIGHVAARHGIKKLQAALGYQLLLGIALKESSSGLVNSVDFAFNIINLGYSREDERLSDKLAVKYASKAGYDPQSMVSFFRKLKAESDRLGPHFNLVFLSSHPSVEERIENVKQEIRLLFKNSSDYNPENWKEEK